MEALHTVIEYFIKGGLVMWPLLLCSIIVVAIAIERYLYFKEADSGSVFADKFTGLLEQGEMAAAINLAKETKGDCAGIVVRTAEMKGTIMQKMNFMETQSGLAIACMRKRINYLSIIVTMSPLLGLLGTIVGMINSFSIFNLKAGQPMAITGGIGEALIATATGLCVAILALAVHSLFAQLLDTAITNMEQCFSSLVEAEGRVKNNEA